MKHYEKFNHDLERINQLSEAIELSKAKTKELVLERLNVISDGISAKELLNAALYDLDIKGKFLGYPDLSKATVNSEMMLNGNRVFVSLYLSDGRVGIDGVTQINN